MVTPCRFAFSFTSILILQTRLAQLDLPGAQGAKWEGTTSRGRKASCSTRILPRRGRNVAESTGGPFPHVRRETLPETCCIAGPNHNHDSLHGFGYVPVLPDFCYDKALVKHLDPVLGTPGVPRGYPDPNLVPPFALPVGIVNLISFLRASIASQAPLSVRFLG